MKKKNILSENATKGDLLILKKDIDIKFNEIDIKFNEIDIKFNDLEYRLDSNAQKYRDEILTKLDGVMGELETMGQENTIGTHQISNLQLTADDHAKRIKHLEKIQQAA